MSGCINVGGNRRTPTALLLWPCSNYDNTSARGCFSARKSTFFFQNTNITVKPTHRPRKPDVRNKNSLYCNPNERTVVFEWMPAVAIHAHNPRYDYIFLTRTRRNNNRIKPVKRPFVHAVCSWQYLLSINRDTIVRNWNRSIAENNTFNEKPDKRVRCTLYTRWIEYADHTWPHTDWHLKIRKTYEPVKKMTVISRGVSLEKKRAAYSEANDCINIYDHISCTSPSHSVAYKIILKTFFNEKFGSISGPNAQTTISIDSANHQH